MSDPRQILAMLKEVFPNYTDDLITCVMEAVGGTFEASLEALLSLDSEAQEAEKIGALESGFLELGGEAGEAGHQENVEVQRQLEQIIKESREEAKQGKKQSVSWKQKLKNVFKKKEKPQEQVAAPRPASQSSLPAPSHQKSVSQSSPPASSLQKSSSQSIPPPLTLEKSPSLPLHAPSKPQTQEDDDEEIISFSMAEDPKDIRGAKYRPLPTGDDIELVYTKKS